MARQDTGQDLEKIIIRFLRSKGCMVFLIEKPTILFLKEGFWGAIECKRSKTAKYRPGQKAMVAKMDEMSWARVAYPEKWGEIRKELEEILR